MPSHPPLRATAREIFDEALRAVDAGDAVRRAVCLANSRLKICDLEFDSDARQIYFIAIGKAAISMAVALEDQLGNRFAQGLIAGGHGRQIQNRGSTASLFKRRWYQGGHPLPDKRSMYAGSYALELLARANERRALVIFLISGGGSAMMEWPVSEDITLANLRIANKVLVNCGASIAEINSVRRALSAVKGGKLAARAPNCDQITLIVSDVPKGQEWNVASGPTIPPPPAPNARDVIDKYDLRNQLPAPIVRAIDSEAACQPEQTTKLRHHIVLLDNNTALQATAEAARARGFVTEIASDISDQSIEAGCELLLHRLDELRSAHRASSQPVCLISGGEFACPVRGTGIGGRNLETALRLAMSERFVASNTVALCAGTDGIDGNSPAAGAILDCTTLDRASKIGLDARDYLRSSDSYSFFEGLDDAITTGPTGTNVRDVRILLAPPESQ